jgi:hypothetical protein
MAKENDNQTPHIQITAAFQNVNQAGYDFMAGAMRCAATYILLGFIIAVALTMARNWLALGMDDSDKDGWQRSGLTIHTDAKTGIQYLSDGHGGLVRREDK